MTTLTAGNFADHLNLDYAVSLMAGETNVDAETSAVVSRLVEWSAERGYEISRQDAADVLESVAQQQTQDGINE
jgi:hypothetical protein